MTQGEHRQQRSTSSLCNTIGPAVVELVLMGGGGGGGWLLAFALALVVLVLMFVGVWWYRYRHRVSTPSPYISKHIRYGLYRIWPLRRI